MSRKDGHRLDAALWADLPHSEIEALIAESRRVGWRDALHGVESRAPTFAKRMKNVGLGNWHLILGKGPESRALDIGSGFGSLVLGLSQYYEGAVGLEFLGERIAYSAVRAEQEGLNGRFTRGNGLHLPFADGAFSLATLNGVLEWAGLYENSTSPDSLQVAMLQEARRVVGDAGHVAVAIENRFALESLLAMRDTHTGLHFVTALPRWAANVVTRLRTNTAYRTYLYGHRGYHRLFERAGFGECRILDLISSYNDYDFVIDTTDVLSYGFVYDHGLVRPFFDPAGRARNTLRRLTPSMLSKLSYAYLVIGGDDVANLLDVRHEVWRKTPSWNVDASEARFACNGTTAGSLAIVSHDGRAARTLLEVGRHLTGPATQPTTVATDILRACAPTTTYAGFSRINGVGVRAFHVAQAGELAA